MPAGKLRTVLQRSLDALRRVDELDRRGPRLNALPLINPQFLNPANASGPLAGRIFSGKASLAVQGMALSAGSPAFASIIGSRDARVVEMLKAAGAILLGKTNMPPVAIGGGQAGLHGRTLSPFNPAYLAAAWHSGSSIGSAVTVAAGYCDFSIGEETVSSGRSPASNNGIVAYTPSWGVISSVGNLPLHPYRDVIVPYTTDVSSLVSILQVIAGKDQQDVWYRQNAVPMQAAARAIEALRNAELYDLSQPLRLGVPHLFVGKSVGGVAAVPIRPSLKELWTKTEDRLRSAGVELVPVSFPVVETYESRAETRNNSTVGFAPDGWTEFELGPLMTWAWSAFLHSFGDGTRLSDLVAESIRPAPPWSTDLLGRNLFHSGKDSFNFEQILHAATPDDNEVFSVAEPAIYALDNARKVFHDDWLESERLDGLVFPANGDVGPWAAESSLSAAVLAWTDGSVFSNGNHVFRRVGIPSVTVPMGVLEDIGMPVGLTLVGRGWDDSRLLNIASHLEKILPERATPSFTPCRAEALSFHESLKKTAISHRPALVSISASNASSSSRVIVRVQNNGSQTVSIEMLGREFVIEPGDFYSFEAASKEWDISSPPLAVLLSALDIEPEVGFAEVPLDFGAGN